MDTEVKNVVSVELKLKDGIHWDNDIEEYVIVLDGEIQTYASNSMKAGEIYLDYLRSRRANRCIWSQQSAAGFTARVADDGAVSYD